MYIQIDDKLEEIKKKKKVDAMIQYLENFRNSKKTDWSKSNLLRMVKIC